MELGQNLGETNYRNDLHALQELKWKASAYEGYNISELLNSRDDKSVLKIEYGEKVLKNSVTDYSVKILKILLLLSDSKSLKISSAYRGPEDQVRAMYNNLEAGTRIKYRSPGAAVTSAYDRAKKSSLTESGIKQKMIEEIHHQGPENVTKHASSPTWLNVIDVAPSSIPAAKRTKFIDAVNKLTGLYIDKFLHPGNSKDPAYHIEIPQGRTLVIRDESRENA